jgi:hypothetical protein
LSQLVKCFTNEELWQKAEYEGIDYLFLDYLDINSILNYNLRKAVQEYRSAFEEIQNILEEYEPDEDK